MVCMGCLGHSGDAIRTFSTNGVIAQVVSSRRSEKPKMCGSIPTHPTRPWINRTTPTSDMAVGPLIRRSGFFYKRVSYNGSLCHSSKVKTGFRLPQPAHGVSVSSDESQLRGLGGQKASDSTHFLALWLNGYNAGLSHRVVWIRIPVEPLKRNNFV